MKRKLSLFIALCISLVAFTGCFDKEGDINQAKVKYTKEQLGGLELPLAKNNPELTMITLSNNDVNDTYAIKKLREVTGVNVKVTSVPEATFTNKMNILLASKQLTDIFPMTGTYDQVNDLALQGAFEPVNDYFDKMPNFKSLFIDNEENNWFIKSYSAKDGKLYIVPSYNGVREVNHCLMYRKDIFDKHGLELWDNNDEFYMTLKKLKEIYPNSTPLTGRGIDLIFKVLNSGLMTTNAKRTTYDEKNNNWFYTDTNLKMKEDLMFFKKLYDEELVDKEFQTNTLASYTNKMTQNDKAFVTFDWISRMDMFKEQTKDTIPDYDLRFAPPIGDKKIAKNSIINLGDQLECVSSSSSNIELSMKMIDFFLSKAGAELMTMGIEGEIFNINERGYASYPEFSNKVPSIEELKEKYGLFQLKKRFDTRSSYFDLTIREREAQNYANASPKNVRLPEPNLVFTDDENKILTDKLSNLIKIGDEMKIQFLHSSNPEKVWNEWIVSAERAGSREIENIYNEAQKRYDKR